MRSCGAAACLPVVLTLACDPGASRTASGEPSSLIVVVIDSLWAVVGDSVTAALERPIFAVRDESTFDVTHVSPTTEPWLEARRYRQIVPIGQPGDGWIAPMLGRNAPDALPAVVEARNVWARDQGVTGLIVPPGAGAEAVYAALPALADTLHRRYEQYALNRMFLSGVDSAGRDSLRAAAGFSLLLPQLYRREQRDSTWIFRAHTEMGGALMRTVLLTWLDGSAGDLTGERVLDLRDSLAIYDPAQITQREPVQVETVTFPGGSARQVRGVWTGTDPSFPAAGAFITRVMHCPEQNRTYVLDAWLYAPNRQKHEYLLQLGHILNSFRCEGPARADGA